MSAYGAVGPPAKFATQTYGGCKKINPAPAASSRGSFVVEGKIGGLRVTGWKTTRNSQHRFTGFYALPKHPI
ncbi:hypothetical protein SBDP1_1290007 [Syntrophobacter sp. SbD1]|nr:hypothetical protein SBDP1_1290007 [Syntrophobacter sp. SbD1]